MIHTSWCRRQSTEQHVNCSNCPCHTGTSFVCPACGGRSRWPESVDLDHLEETLEHGLEWDLQRIKDLVEQLHREKLIRDPDGLTPTSAIPWVEVCEHCATGKQRCETCHAIMSSWRVGEKDCSRCYRKRHGFKEKTPDSQRQKVYSMEHRVFRRSFAVNTTTEEAVNLLKRLSHRFHVSTPELKNMPGRAFTRGGDYRSGRIRAVGVDRGRVSTGTVIHEFAHHLVRAYHKDVAAHGPEFVRCLYESMNHAGYADDRPSRSRWKVKIGRQSNFWDAVKQARLRHGENTLTIRA